MKIVKFAGENFKRLRAVEITPDGNIVPISGRNAQGKTSVLDAIWCTVGGRTAAKDTPRPVRDGEESATVQLDLGDIIVTRTWDAKGKTSLKVTSPDGARFSSPQKTLDDLVGKLAFGARLPSRPCPRRTSASNCSTSSSCPSTSTNSTPNAKRSSTSGPTSTARSSACGPSSTARSSACGPSWMAWRIPSTSPTDPSTSPVSWPS